MPPIAKTGNMLMTEQKKAQPKIVKQVARPAKPAGEGMGMAPKKSPVNNLGKFAHPPKKMGIIKRKG